MQPKKARGFTLLELIIVIIIIAILSAIGFISYTNSKYRANYVKVRGDMQEIISAATMYKVDHKTYPVDAFPNIFTTFGNYLTSPPIAPCPRYQYDWQNVDHYAGVDYEEPPNGSIPDKTEGAYDSTRLFYYPLTNDPDRDSAYGNAIQDIRTFPAEQITCKEAL